MKAVIVNTSHPSTVCTVEKLERVTMLVALPEGGVIRYGDDSAVPDFGAVPMNRTATVRRKRVDLIRDEVRLLVEDYEEIPTHDELQTFLAGESLERGDMVVLNPADNTVRKARP